MRNRPRFRRRRGRPPPPRVFGSDIFLFLVRVSRNALSRVGERERAFFFFCCQRALLHRRRRCRAELVRSSRGTAGGRHRRRADEKESVPVRKTRVRLRGHTACERSDDDAAGAVVFFSRYFRASLLHRRFRTNKTDRLNLIYK